MYENEVINKIYSGGGNIVKSKIRFRPSDLVTIYSNCVRLKVEYNSHDELNALNALP